MNRSSFVLIAVVVGTLSLVATGCTPPGENLVAAGIVSVERQSAGRVTVSRVDVYQDGPMLIVDGSLRHSGIARHRSSLGHIDVAVVDPDGKVLAQKNFRDTWQSHSHGRAYFTTRLPLTPSKGSIVKVVFHDSKTVPASGHTDAELAELWKRQDKG